MTASLMSCGLVNRSEAYRAPRLPRTDKCSAWMLRCLSAGHFRPKRVEGLGSDVRVHEQPSAHHGRRARSSMSA